MTQPEESGEKAPKTDDVIKRGDPDRRTAEEPPPPDGERTELRAAMDEARARQEARGEEPSA